MLGPSPVRAGPASSEKGVPLTTIVRRMRRTRPVRAVGIPLYRFGARLRPGHPPRVLANSLPKAGTHLLTALLAELPDMRFSGVHVTAYDLHDETGYLPRNLDRLLRPVRTGQYVSAHLPASPTVVEAVTRLRYRSLFIVRDPRDVAVSDVFYILGYRQHPLHGVLTAIPTMDERLDAVLRGLPDTRRGLPLMEPIGERLDNYLGWLDAPGTAVVRFERLVGARGGGDDTEQLREVQAVAAHVDRPLSDEQARATAAKVWSPRSSTFRKGAIGEWRRYFDDRHADYVRRTAGAQLVALGYERDTRW